MATLIAVSVIDEETRRLTQDGPRRDFIELARCSGGRLLYAQSSARPTGLLGRLFGPHVRHAWRVARSVGNVDRLLVDG
jgi:hypothetical protein